MTASRWYARRSATFGSMSTARLAEAFAERYGFAPTAFVRAPGRVNLIGEHIDYAGLPVLPMALQREVRLAFAPRTDATVRVANTDPAFEPRTFAVQPDVEPFALGDWGNYVKAAVAGVAGRYGTQRGFDALVDSDLPVAAGLSSSSALVVGCALALLAANGSELADRVDLMELLAGSEQYVGTAGGGMDQAICLGARRGFAMRITFDPLRLTALPVPPRWRFVIAYSIVRAAKSGAAQEAYNRRRSDCERALEIMIDHFGRRGAITTYAGLLMDRSVNELLETARGILDPVLAQRFRHVVTEARRVFRAEAALLADDAALFGRAMNESHRSLRDDYEVSSAALDRLVELALAGGAAGARLTGAGFGGSIVALATDANLDAVLDRLAEFYDERSSGDALAPHLFVAQPSDAASVAAFDS